MKAIENLMSPISAARRSRREPRPPSDTNRRETKPSSDTKPTKHEPTSVGGSALRRTPVFRGPGKQEGNVVGPAVKLSKASGRVQHAEQPGDNDDQGGNIVEAARLSTEYLGDLARWPLLSNLSHGDQRQEQRGLVDNRRATRMTPGKPLMEEIKNIRFLSRENPEASLEKATPVTKGDTGADHETETRTASDDTTKIFWSHSGSCGYTTETCDASSSSDEMPPADGVVAGGVRRAAESGGPKEPSFFGGRHVAPSPPPRPPSCETPRRRSGRAKVVSTAARAARSRKSSPAARQTAARGREAVRASSFSPRPEERGGGRAKEADSEATVGRVDDDESAVGGGSWSASSPGRVKIDGASAAGGDVGREGKCIRASSPGVLARDVFNRHIDRESRRRRGLEGGRQREKTERAGGRDSTRDAPSLRSAENGQVTNGERVPSARTPGVDRSSPTVGNGDGRERGSSPAAAAAARLAPSSTRSASSGPVLRDPSDREHGGRREEESGAGGVRESSPAVVSPAPPSAGERGRSSRPAPGSAAAERWSSSRAEMTARRKELIERRFASSGVAADKSPPVHDGREPSCPEPAVWVKRHWDYWGTYGLAFLLSDGSFCLYFKDDTKMIFDAAGITFDYIDPTCPHGGEPGAVVGNGEAPGYPRSSSSTTSAVSHKYTLDYFPFCLRKKLEILRYFREHLLLDDDDDDDDRKESMPATAAAVEQTRQSPLTYIEQWVRRGETLCFQLSDKTMQVLFGDGTEVLLSKDCRLVTLVDKDGKRQTQPRRKAEHRADLMQRRIRQPIDIAIPLLDRDETSDGGRSLADAP